MELSPEERDRIFQEEKARREAQKQLEAEEKKKASDRAGRFTLGCLGSIFLVIVIIALISTSKTSNEGELRKTALAVPTPSGKPIVAYSLKRPQWLIRAACGTKAMNVIASRPVSEQELIDLALALHSQYPDTYFEILDDQSLLKDFDQAADLPGAERRLGESRLHQMIDSLKPWQAKPYLGTIMLAGDGGEFKWKLIGGDAQPSKANEEICLLDTKTISNSECVAAAAK